MPSVRVDSARNAVGVPVGGREEVERVVVTLSCPVVEAFAAQVSETCLKQLNRRKVEREHRMRLSYSDSFVNMCGQLELHITSIVHDELCIHIQIGD